MFNVNEDSEIYHVLKVIFPTRRDLQLEEVVLASEEKCGGLSSASLNVVKIKHFVK